MARPKMLFALSRLFTKCRAAGISEFQGLLDWRNTPSEGMDTSPAQRLMGRRCKTLLPTSETLLEPRFSPLDDANKLRIHPSSLAKLSASGYLDQQCGNHLLCPSWRNSFSSQSKRPLAYRRGSTVGYAFGPVIFGRNYASARRAAEAQPTVPVDLPQVSSSPVRRSTRQRRPPAYLKDFVA